MSAELRHFAFSIFQYNPHLSPVQWCESQLSIAPTVSAEPGPFSLFSRPWLREILETFGDTETSDLVLQMCAQFAGKSTVINAGALFRVKNRPTPTLFVFPSETLAGSFSDNRLRPMIEASPELRALKPNDSDAFKRLEYRLSTATVTLIGANSPAALSGRPVGLCVVDETDKLPDGGGLSKEASAINLAIERTGTFPNAKRIYASTPTTSEGAIASLFLRGDQRKFFCPCPHCTELIDLQWPQVKWDPAAKDEKSGEWDLRRVSKTTFYECQNCNNPITDAQKPKMVRAGKWIPSNPNPAPGWKSYTINALYSPSATFGKLALKFIQAKNGTLADLQSFVNSTLAEVWEADKPTRITDENLAKLAGTNERGQFDATDGGHNLLAIDVQRDRFVWCVRRFFRGMRSHLVDWGESLGYDQLDAVFEQYRCALACIDSGQGTRTAEIYEAVAARVGRWVAVKGQPGKMGEFYRETAIDPFTGKREAGRMTIPLLHVNDEHWTRELLARLDGTIGFWGLCKDVDLVYQRQITGVRRVERKKKNGETETFFRYSPPYDLFDCEKYALCLAHVAGLGRPEPAAGDTAPTSTDAAFEVIGEIDYRQAA